MVTCINPNSVEIPVGQVEIPDSIYFAGIEPPGSIVVTQLCIEENGPESEVTEETHIGF